MDAAIKIATPTLLQIPWLEYLPNYNPIDPNDRSKKLTGVLAGFKSGPDGVKLRSQHLKVKVRDRFEGFLSLKEGVLEVHTDLDASLQRRSPENDTWAGAIRSNVNPKVLCSLTKLPDLGDHLVVANNMNGVGLVTDDHLHLLTQPDFEGMREILEFYESDAGKLAALQELISTVMSNAMTTARKHLLATANW